MEKATSEVEGAGQSRQRMALSSNDSTASGTTSGVSDSGNSDLVDETAAVPPAGQHPKQKAQPSPQLPRPPPEATQPQPQPAQAAQHAQTAQNTQTTQNAAKAAQSSHASQPPHQSAQQPTQKTTSSTAGPSTSTRPRGQKHVVGGGGSTARLHARVPSSKALHKAVHQHHHHMHHVASTSSAKLSQRRQLSPSPPPVDFAAQFPFAAPPSQAPTTTASSSSRHHRRSSSGPDGNGKFARSDQSSSTTSLLRKNASATSLKRNRSTADVTKRPGHGFVVGHGTRPTAHLKRSYSNPAVTEKQRALHNNNKPSHVRFEIGTPDPHDDEWVDAGSSTLADSHKDSFPKEVVTRGNRKAEDGQKSYGGITPGVSAQQSLKLKEQEILLPLRPANGRHIRQASTDTNTARNTTPIAPPAVADEHSKALQRKASSSSTALNLLASHNSKTRLLLPRTPSRGAPPKMSTETASATTQHHTRSSSSDSSSSSSQQQLQAQQRKEIPQNGDDVSEEQTNGISSGDTDLMTSRFITAGSHESVSGATGEGSFYTTSSSRPGTGREAADDQKNTPASGHHSAAMTHLRRSRSIGGDTTSLTDDEESPVLVASSRPATASGGSGNPRRTPLQQAPPAELSRTQQKLNLERASSSLDRNGRQHQGPAAGPLLGAGGFGMHDPRIGKLMEKTGMEYYVVRRYQNPVTRSLARLTTRLGGDKNWHIPVVNGNRSSTPTEAPGAGSRSGAGLSQSFRERDIRREAIHHSAVSAAAANSGTVPGLQRTRTMPLASATTEPETERPLDYSNGNRPWRLSGNSLVDGEEEDGTAVLLRNLWDKNLYLGTSQE